MVRVAVDLAVLLAGASMWPSLLLTMLTAMLLRTSPASGTNVTAVNLQTGDISSRYLFPKAPSFVCCYI